MGRTDSRTSETFTSTLQATVLCNTNVSLAHHLTTDLGAHTYVKQHINSPIQKILEVILRAHAERVEVGAEADADIPGDGHVSSVGDFWGCTEEAADLRVFDVLAD